VSILITSPTFTNGGTWTIRPVSSVAFLYCADAVAFFMEASGLDDLELDGLGKVDTDRVPLMEGDLDDGVRQDNT